MAMITIGKNGFLNLNADDISSVKFEEGEYDRYTRSLIGAGTIIEMRNGTRHNLGPIGEDSQKELIAKISEAMNHDRTR